VGIFAILIFLPPPDSGIMVLGHQVQETALAYVSEYGRSDCGFSHLEMLENMYGCYHGVCFVVCFVLHCGNMHFSLRLLDVTEFTILTPLSLLISYKC
jgi:hypothetical protein